MPASNSAGATSSTSASTPTRIAPGDFFDIPPGHDAYVAGDKRVELILFAPPEHAH